MATPADLNPDALKKALKAIEQRDRFESEVRNILIKAEFDEETVEKVVRYLKERRFINDRRTITNEIARRSERRAVGRDRIREELLARGASESDLNELLDSMTNESETESALALLKVKYRSTDDRRKGGRYLYGRGFSESTIEQALDRFFEPVDDDDG